MESAEETRRATSQAAPRKIELEREALGGEFDILRQLESSGCATAGEAIRYGDRPSEGPPASDRDNLTDKHCQELLEERALAMTADASPGRGSPEDGAGEARRLQPHIESFFRRPDCWVDRSRNAKRDATKSLTCPP